MKKNLFTIMLAFFVVFSITAQKRQAVSVEKSPFSTNTVVSSEKAQWDILFSFDALESGSPGIETDGTNFYTTRWNGSDFHRYDMDGANGVTFSVAGVSNVRDMAYDGQYFYGAAANMTLFQMDLANETLVSTINASCSGVTGIRHISYDPNLDGGNGGFWVGNWTELGAIAMDGSELVPSTVTLESCYGSAYDNWTDSSNPKLWLFQQPTGAEAIFYEFDINTYSMTGTTFTADAANISGGACSYEAGGLFILVANIQQDPNRVIAYELAQMAAPTAPNVPTSVTAVPDAGGALTVQLDWTNPAIDVNGDALTELTSIDVYLDGGATAIYTNGSPAIGGTDSYTATTTGGNHTFKIVGTNSAGVGIPVETTVFVGVDVAVTATNVPDMLILNQTFVPTVTVVNNGVGDQTFDVTLSDGDAYSNVVSVTSLASGATQELTFPEWNASSAVATFTFTATAADPGSDIELANNVSTSTLSVIDMILFDFEADDQGWTFGGEFERAAPSGLGGEHGNPDPAAAYAGTNCIGTDLTGLGAYPGDYEASLSDRADFAISPVIDCSAETMVTMKFQQYLNVESPTYDHAYIDISTDGGTNWTELWTNDAAVGDAAWHEVTMDISAEAAGQSSVQIRFANGVTDGSWLFSGWNIDNFMINGQLVGSTNTVTFNVNMADSIASGYFVEGTDQLWLAGSMNTWTTPGDDAAYEMTESTTNDIYTVNVDLEDGDYEYKYFKIVGGASSWDNGEWAGGSNRSFTVAGADLTLDDVYGLMPVGIEDIAAKGISVYPNPSNGTFTVNVENNFNLEVLDITGKVINTQVLNGTNTVTINNAGVYFLRFSNNEGSVTQKVIVQ